MASQSSGFGEVAMGPTHHKIGDEGNCLAVPTEETPRAANQIFFPLSKELSGLDSAEIEIDVKSTIKQPWGRNLSVESEPDYWIADESLNLVNGLHFRYLSANDQFKTGRDAWVSKHCNNIEYFNLNFQETHSISRMNGSYHILLVGGNDSSRISKFIKSNEALVGSQPRLAIMNRSDPRRRVQVLNAGFDDVLDCDRTKPAEMYSRIFALWRRHEMVRQVSKKKEEEVRKIWDVALADKKLTAAEQRVLTLLSENVGKVVSYTRLAEIASKDYEKVTFNHLKVIISHIRHKIQWHCTIASANSFGYIMTQVGKI
jgi:DNA-binding response OmpR family regulator